MNTPSEAEISDYLASSGAAAWEVPGLPAGTPKREIKRVGIIGAGTMGGGIAMNFATAGIPVTIVETTQEALDRGHCHAPRQHAAPPGSQLSQRKRPDETTAKALLVLLHVIAATPRHATPPKMEYKTWRHPVFTLGVCKVLHTAQGTQADAPHGMGMWRRS